MKPEVPEVLAELAGLLVRNADPSVHPADRASDLGMSAMLLGFAAESWDSRAHMLVEENRAFHALLQQGAAHLAVPAPPAEDNLRISALTAENHRLATALIALHAAVENDPSAAALNDAIWVELRTSTERRKLAASVV